MTSAYRRVVLTSGHMIDLPDRSHPRFPPSLEPAVAASIERAFDDWGIDRRDLVVSGGARGADILFAESAHRRGAALELILASDPDDFERSSVALPHSIWSQRFRYLIGKYSYQVPARDADNESSEGFDEVNREMFRRARTLCPPSLPCVALVWDEQPAGGPGGTGEFAVQATALGAEIVLINPVKLSATLSQAT
jgi:hypothetical protein